MRVPAYTCLITQFEKISKSKFVRSVVVIATGTAGAQAITMAFAPIIARLYGPHAFGLMGAFIAVLTVVTPIAALTYPAAIVLPASQKEAGGLVKLSAGLAFVMACFLAVLILLFGDKFAAVPSLEGLADFLVLIPLAMLFSAFHQILQQWLIRQKQFRVTASAAVKYALIVNSAKAGIGLFYPTGAFLIILTTAGHALQALLLLRGFRSTAGSRSLQESGSEVNGLAQLAAKYKDFPFFRAPQAFINAFSHSLPVLMLSAFVGPTAAGFYVLSRSVLNTPLTLVSKSVGDVFYPYITDASNNKENIQKLIFRTTLALVGVGCVPFFIFIIYGPRLFSFVFGEAWSVAGDYARWMSLWLFCGFINRPSVVAIPVLRLLDAFLVYEIISTLLRIVAMYIGLILYENPVLAVALFSVAGAVFNLLLIIYVIYRSGLKR